MRLIYLPLCLAALALSGCDKDAQSSEAKEERNPLVKTGQSYMDIKNWNKAEEAFLQAIENNPKMARPHLDLAILYHLHIASDLNLVKAIYHYDRYVKLRPDSEKVGMINEQKKAAAQALVGKAVENSPQVQQLVGERNRLQQENTALKRQLAALNTSAQPKTAAITTAPVKTGGSKAVTDTVPKSAAVAGDAQHQIYTVVAGDNLTRIAKKFYGTGDYEPIYEANKDRMKSPGDLRVGQTLVIPKR